MSSPHKLDRPGMINTLARALAAALVAFTLSTSGCAAAPPGATSSAEAPATGRPIILGRAYTLNSRVLGGARTINVYLPEHYSGSDRKFPVLFLLDGGEQEDFVHIAALAQITAAYGAGQEMIVVGIEGVDRRHDLTSPSSAPEDRKRAPTSGGAADYRRFLVEELKPWVAARYRTSGGTALIGESLAGHFILETFLKQPESFDDFIAVSPSLWWNRSSLAQNAAADLRGRRYAGKRLWIGFEEPAPPQAEAAKERLQQEKVEAALKASGTTGLSWTVRRFEEGHGTVYHPAALAALRQLYAAPSTAK